MERLISENDQEFADVFSRFVNGKMGSAQRVGEKLADDHRFLVNEKFKVVMAFIDKLSSVMTRVTMTLETSGLASWRHPS